MEGYFGKVNLEHVVERKALYPAEQQAEPATVCVTGAAGYIASRIVARLLAAGHTVHATCRPAADDAATQAALRELPGADERLKWFQADLLEEGSFDDAIAGCKYVIHTAGVVTMMVPKRHAYARCIEPALLGVENVLRSVNRAGTVEKVVVTSSLGAVMGDGSERGEGHVYTEADFNVHCQKLGNPYFTAKTLAEWQAWAIAGQQDRWKLVTICPGAVYGPPLAAIKNCESLDSMKRLMDGTYYPFIAPLGLTSVDVDDVAAAHTLAMVLPQAAGRYLLSERAVLMTEITAALREMYPAYWVPTITVPFPLAVLILVLSRTMSYRWVKALYNKKVAIDCSKAQRELGLQFIPMEKTLRDMMDRLLELGLLARIPAYSTAAGAVPLPHAAPAVEPSGVAGAVGVVKHKLAAVAAEAEAAVHHGGKAE